MTLGHVINHLSERTGLSFPQGDVGGGLEGLGEVA